MNHLQDTYILSNLFNTESPARSPPTPPTIHVLSALTTSSTHHQTDPTRDASERRWWLTHPHRTRDVNERMWWWLSHNIECVREGGGGCQPHQEQDANERRRQRHTLSEHEMRMRGRCGGCPTTSNASKRRWRLQNITECETQTSSGGDEVSHPRRTRRTNIECEARTRGGGRSRYTLIE